MKKISLFLVLIFPSLYSFINAQLIINADHWPYGIECIGNKWYWSVGENGTWGGYDPNPIDSTWDFSLGPTASYASSEIIPIGESLANLSREPSFIEEKIFDNDTTWWWESKDSSAHYLYGFTIQGTNIYFNPPYRRLYIFPMMVGTNWNDYYSWDYAGITIYDTIQSEIINQGYVIVPEGGPYQCLVMRCYESSYGEFMGVPVVDEDYIIYQWIVPDVGICVNVQSQNKETNPYYTTYKDFFRLDTANFVGIDKKMPAIDPNKVYLKIRPNPALDRCLLHFALSEKENVSLTIYNVAGAKVKTIVQKTLNEGTYIYEWNGRDEKGHKVLPGVYFVRLKTGDFTSVKKVILVK